MRLSLAQLLAILGLVLSVVLGLATWLYPEVIEGRAHAALMAATEDALQKLPAKHFPHGLGRARRMLVDICKFCSPRPRFVLEDDSFELGAAHRFYVGAVLDFFVGIFSVLGINAVASIAAFFWKPRLKSAAAGVGSIVVVTELLGLVALRCAPGFLTGLDFPFAYVWALLLIALVVACSSYRPSASA